MRDIGGVREREKGESGVLRSIERHTQPMRHEAASAGFEQAPWGNRYARLQLITIEEIFGGKGIDYPRENVTFKKAPTVRPEAEENEELPF